MAESGLRRTTRNRVRVTPPWVRIPLSPPDKKGLQDFAVASFLYYDSLYVTNMS